ncbi:hypothetical protein PINS_up009020 [Pythium insidiosum]|nr:hypothetical protein PINS_up009020 [Pythium insidiosum]
MHSVWTRLNALVFGSLTAIAVLAGLTTLSTYNHVATPVVRRLELQSLQSLRKYRDNTDRATLTFNLDADLSSVFNWNVKQLFVYVVASFQTPSNEQNEVVIWDRIIQTKDAAATQLTVENEGVEYFLADQHDELRGANVTLRLEWDIMPVCGRLFIHSHDQRASFVMPSSYVGSAPRRGF